MKLTLNPFDMDSSNQKMGFSAMKSLLNDFGFMVDEN